MKKIIRISVIVMIVAMILGTLGYLYSKSKPAKVVFKTKSPIMTTIVKKTVATGSVVPRKEIEIKPQVSGIISEVYVTAGKRINAGDLIAKIQIIPDMLSLNNAESRLERAKVAYDDAKIEYDRQKQLLDQKIIPIAEFQKTSLSFQNANLELKSSEDNLQLVKEGVTKKSGGVTNTLIRSTISGMVLDVPVKTGSRVTESNQFNAGTTVAIVADMGEMIFQGKVDETEVGKLKVSMPLTLTIGAIESQKFDAILEYISPKGVAENGAIQFEIKAKVQLRDNQFIRAGYSANADIVLEKKTNIMAIEESLMQFEKEKPFVEIEIAPQKFEKKFIKIGISDGINVEVTNGLTIKNKIKSLN